MLKNAHLWVFWSWCLLKASWQPIKIWVGKQEVELNPGQFIFGRHAASKETGLSEQTIRTCMYNLVNSKNLTIKVTNKFSIITICNWEIYQENISQTNQQTNQPLTNNQPTTNHKQEVKNIRSKDKEEKNKKYGEHVRLSHDEYAKLISKFGERGTAERIEAMNLYAAQIGKSKFAKYKSHYATILNWSRRENGHKDSQNRNRQYMQRPVGEQAKPRNGNPEDF